MKKLTTVQKKVMLALFKERDRIIKYSNWRGGSWYVVQDSNINWIMYVTARTFKCLLNAGYLRSSDNRSFKPNYNLIEEFPDENRLKGDWYKSLIQQPLKK